MNKHIIIFGSIAGVVVSVMLALSYNGSNTNFEYSEIIGYATMVIAFSTIFIAVKNQRDKIGNGTITFGNALKVGLGVTLVASALYILSWMVISETIAKDFMSDYYQRSVEQLKASNLAEEELRARIADMEAFQEMYKNPVVKIGITFLEIFPVGLIVSLIAAFLLKRSKEPEVSGPTSS
jgi:hypothetical protein